MPHAYSEDKLIEQTCIKLLREELGWETINVFQGERLGKDGTLCRESERDVILKCRFLDALKRLNPDLPPQAYELAYEELNAETSTLPLADTNYQKYLALKDGIAVNYKNERGEIIRNKRLRVFDFENPKSNNFLAVQQLWVEGKSMRRKRPDIVGFVNGVPLLFMELKAHHKQLRLAFDHNLKDYKSTIPRLFHFNAFLILSNGLESRIGAITSKYEHFHEWKRIHENEEGIVSLETILKGVCDKSRFMDLFENFILFDKSLGGVVKLIAQNHQYLGVNKAIEHFQVQLNRYKHGLIEREEAQRLGVFWHTQGSGKSYSMVFFTEKISRKVGGYTFLLVTDRNELDTQIFGTFAGVHAVKDEKTRANSGKHLMSLLLTDAKYIFALIHKFNFDTSITERENIIVISDEAHRTQGGTLAINMRKALPNASFMGFTGTPLFKDDELTRRIFGDYVSVYDFQRSVEDGATVPLYYENRGEKLQLDNPKINEEIKQAIEEAELDSDQEEKLRRLFANAYPILTAEKRLRSIAKDAVEHFNSRGYKGKAMYVAIDKVTAVRMYDYIAEEWQAYLKRRTKQIEKLTDAQEALAQGKEWQWSSETEIAVIISNEQNEVGKFEDWGLNIEPHRMKMNTRDLETDFKNDKHPFRFVIVCAMWITGFDVKSLSTMYIDKPMKSHTLMQTIARANRVYGDKNNGLIVDYIETYKALLEALAIYAIGGTKKPDDEDNGKVKPPLQQIIEVLVPELEEAIEATEVFLRDEVEFVLDTIIESEGLGKIRAIHNGVEAVYTNDETKNKYGILAREVFKKYSALKPNAAIYDYKPKRDAINAIYSVITDNTYDADITSVVRQVQHVVDQSIENLNSALEPVEGYGTIVDLSGLDFERIEAEFLKLDKGKQNVAVSSLKERIETKLFLMMAENPYTIDYYERYQEIIKEYNSGKDYRVIKEIFDKLLDLYGNLTDEKKRAQRENLSEDELAVFDMLGRDKSISDNEKDEMKETAKKLLKTLSEDQFKIKHWADNGQTSSAVKTVIRNHLWETLPSHFNELEIDGKTDVLFHFFKSRYGDYGNRAYTS